MISFIFRYKAYLIAAIAGFSLAMLISSVRINSLKADWMAERQALTKAHNDALKKNIETNARLNLELLNKQNELINVKQQLERSIDNAIQNDGVSYNGLGDDSLQLYKRAFGYSRENNTITDNDKAASAPIAAKIGQP